jgi:predicted amidophosphoribosyltransferase
LAKDRSSSDKKGEAPCACPFCDAPLERAYPFCKTCGRDLKRCPGCGRVIPQDEEMCPECKG